MYKNCYNETLYGNLNILVRKKGHSDSLAGTSHRCLFIGFMLLKLPKRFNESRSGATEGTKFARSHELDGRCVPAATLPGLLPKAGFNTLSQSWADRCLWIRSFVK